MRKGDAPHCAPGGWQRSKWRHIEALSAPVGLPAQGLHGLTCVESLKAAPTVTNLTAFDVLPGSAPVCLAVHFLLTPLALARYTMGFERLVKPRVAYSPLVVAP